MQHVTSVIERPSLLYDLPSILQRIELTKIFPKTQPVEVELGSGDGSFLVEYAAQHLEHNFIGVERLLGRIRSCLPGMGRGLGKRKSLKTPLPSPLPEYGERETDMLVLVANLGSTSFKYKLLDMERNGDVVARTVRYVVAESFWLPFGWPENVVY